MSENGPTLRRLGFNGSYLDLDMDTERFRTVNQHHLCQIPQWLTFRRLGKASRPGDWGVQNGKWSREAKDNPEEVSLLLFSRRFHLYLISRRGVLLQVQRNVGKVACGTEQYRSPHLKLGVCGVYIGTVCTSSQLPT